MAREVVRPRSLAASRPYTMNEHSYQNVLTIAFVAPILTTMQLHSCSPEGSIVEQDASQTQGTLPIAPRAEAGRSPDAATTAQPAPSLARFYMTSDLRAATGLTRTHLDFYLREGIILPTARTESGYLLFDDEELSVLRQVIAWRQDGVGVRDIRDRLGRTPAGEGATG